MDDLPASPFVAPWIKSCWHDRITVEAAPDGCRVFWREVKGECWLWHGWSNGKGHGRVKINGRGQYLHRFSLASFLGIDIGQLDTGDHLCRNRNCFNPTHVEETTHRENYERGDGPTYQFKTDAEYENDNAEIEDDLAAQLRGF